MSPATDMSWRKGACHCGAVSFEVLAGDDVELVDCDCSICAMTGFQHLAVDKGRFRLLAGEDKLTTYTFNTKTARHTFCSVCGIKPFYVPRSNPDGYSVNFRCLNEADFKSVRRRAFNGRNWEQHIGELRRMEA